MRSPVLGAGQAKEKKGGRPTLGASSLAARHLEDETCSRILVPRQAGRRAHGQPWESQTVGRGVGEVRAWPAWAALSCPVRVETMRLTEDSLATIKSLNGLFPLSYMVS